MKQIQSFAALLCVLLSCAPPCFGQQSSGQDNPRGPRLESEQPHWYSTLTRPYEARTVPPVNVSNSSRLDSLVRAGTLYLSLADAIALALENNLDIELERYEYSLAEADLLRAKSGAAILGVPTNVLPGVATGGLGPILGSNSSGLVAVNSPSPLGAGLSYDPMLTGTLNFGHTTTPQLSSFVTGTSSLITANKTADFGISQTFATGGTVSLAYNNIVQDQNSFHNFINPSTVSALDLQITQPLLQGFGLALNNRTIRIAKNNLRAADYVFRQQLLNTVANVVQLYWNLVAAYQNVEVRKRALEVSQKLYDDNKRQVEIGTLAPLEIVRAEAEVASDEQALVAAQSAVLQQEVVLKSALSRNGLASPAIADVRVVTTDPIRIPDVEVVEPIQDLVSRALDNRPDLAQSRIQIENAQIALKGSRDAMRPTLNAVGDLRSNALVGAQNTIIGPVSTTTGLVQVPPAADPFFVGGYGSVLGQLFGRNFPTYSAGLNLSIPLGNRAAQANVATATLNLRQNELQVQRQINQIRVDVRNGIIAVQQARAQYQAAVKQRILEEQTVDADQKRLSVGASTVFQVIQDQRDLATAAANEVTAEAAYAAARVQIDLATGMTLQNNNVELDEAKSGVVARPPAPLPNH